MKYKRVGKIDWDFSVLGFGCWGASGKGSWTGHSDDDQIEAIRKAIELGVNFFDVAPIYGMGHAEEVLGKAIKGFRDKIFIATKGGIPWDAEFNARNDVSRDSLLQEIDDSLRRLNVDYVDLYQVHWPTDSGVPLSETIEALQMIKASGKAKQVGLTNFSKSDLAVIQESVDIVSMQGLYNMLDTDASSYHGINLQYRVTSEIFPLVKAEGMAFFPYSPLFQGLLTGKISEETTFGNEDVRQNNPKLHGEQRTKYLNMINEIKLIPELAGKKISEIALNYLVAKDEVTSVIATHANVDEVMWNVEALSWEMSAETIRKIEGIVG